MASFVINTPTVLFDETDAQSDDADDDDCDENKKYGCEICGDVYHSLNVCDCIAISVRVWVRMPTCICTTKYANLDA